MIFINNFYSLFPLLIASLFALFYLFMKSAAMHTQTYRRKLKLLQLRDELRFLVATEKLSQDDFLFKHFDSFCNTFIKNINNLSLSQLPEAALKENHKEFGKKYEKFLKRLHKEIEKSPKEVQEVVVSIYGEIGLLFLFQNKVLFTNILARATNEAIKSALEKIMIKSIGLFDNSSGDRIFVVNRTKAILNNLNAS